MIETNLMLLAIIIITGIIAQWLAWRIRLPAILPLLLAGILIGPVLKVIEPEALFGPVLLPFISFTVALILFEGGLGLKLRDLLGIGAVFNRLITIGAATTFLLSFAGAYFILDLSPQISALLSAILIVTGPTVILPIVRQIRLKPDLSSLLKWEGIVIDPIGAIVAVITYEVIQVSQVGDATSVVLTGFVKIMLVGGSIGFSMAFLLAGLIRSRQIPDFLHIPVTMALVIGSYTASNMLQAESGLLAVTLMGIVLANQKMVPIKHILEFKENLGVLLLSLLFIVLAARLRLEELVSVQWRSFLFFGLLILVVRPVAILLSTAGTKLNWRERGFLIWMAPRGIVAASVAVIFQEKTQQLGIADSERLVPLVFWVIILTVLLYGFSALPLARKLGLTRTRLNGVLIVGAHAWARRLAKGLQELSIPVLMVDTNIQNTIFAQQDGIPVYAGDILSDELLEDEKLMKEMGQLLALTSNDAVNTLAMQRYRELFGAHAYQLALSGGKMSKTLQGEIAFGEDATYERMERLFLSGVEIVVLGLDTLETPDLRAVNGLLYPLFLISNKGVTRIYTPTSFTKENYKSLIYLRNAGQ
ncbi:MAG: sodium:proton antiporter [Deltaproteobacteria bacterium]|nr:sodium:proton antiporter [Deltaproteobacteria bacterium]